MESSNRGSYMGFKLHQNYYANGAANVLIPSGTMEGKPDSEMGMPVPIALQPLVRPTTTMGGRKKIIVKKLDEENQAA